MRLVVETGQGIPDANSYIDLLDVEKYLVSTDLVNWEKLTEDEKNDRMITASLFIDYSFNWIGQQKTLDQGLSWPRINVLFQMHEIADNYIPRQIKKACIMAISLIMKFGIDIFQVTTEAQIKKEKLGAMETEYFANKKSIYGDTSEYSDINNILRGFFIMPKTGSVMTAEVVRR